MMDDMLMKLCETQRFLGELHRTTVRTNSLILLGGFLLGAFIIVCVPLAWWLK